MIKGNELRKKDMNLIWNVGKGAMAPPRLVLVNYQGSKNTDKVDLALVGKGITYDTGGLNLKPTKAIEEMHLDKGGACAVMGALHGAIEIGLDKNVLFVMAIAENAIGRSVYKPGDIIKSLKGLTVEIGNTDAEGRLVLADAITYACREYQPRQLIDIATLTGSIMVALGEETAGLFSNNDSLSEKIFNAGEKVNEKVWRLPLHKNYDKLINSPIADIQNINYSGGAGSITAAQFLQRFIDKTPWAHLDIAGMAFSKKAANLNPGGATGFGVRLLNQLIEEHYE